MPIGKIETFEIGVHNWDAYCRRVKQFITLNSIPVNLHVATLVTHVGVTCYELMCDLCAPELPENKSFDELVRVVRKHLEPQRSEIAERHIFRQRKQKQDETVCDYLQNLKRLAKTCNFTETVMNPLEVNLRDQFVSGLYNEDMRSRLFAEKDLSYNRAVELALSLEAADRHAIQAGSGGGESRGAAESLHSIAARRERRSAVSPASGQPAVVHQAARCWRCGRNGHSAARCRYKNYSCDQCGQKGHLKVVCRKNTRKSDGSDPKEIKEQHFLDDSGDSELDFYNIICSNNDSPYYIDLKINDITVKFEIDTGSKISMLQESHSGHIGVVKMKQLSRNYLWWDGIDAHIESTCRDCAACAAHRDAPPAHAPLHCWNWPDQPWVRLNLDFLGPYRNSHYLVIVDAHSKWIEVEKKYRTLYHKKRAVGGALRAHVTRPPGLAAPRHGRPRARRAAHITERRGGTAREASHGDAVYVRDYSTPSVKRRG
ncbi:uncharacterized protein LOC131847960 [Achroia grisella]|uniref:uncharacterized protein LOC131847960 n=1 Tax=Achroia grisella TaxID=688607 RepID=UPI0027D32169|nr:uncharacterized protein LOC131847960 [Achroia grisella]